MPESQFTSSLQVSIPQTETIDITPGIEILSSFDKETNTSSIEFNLALDPAAVPQRTTLTIDVASLNEGDMLGVEIESDGVSQPAIAVPYISGDTADKIAKTLATVIDLHPDVVARATGATIEVVSARGGSTFALQPYKYTGATPTTDPGDITESEVQSASGSSAVGKIAQRRTTLNVNAAGVPVLSTVDEYYDGTPATPVVTTSQSNLYTVGSKRIGEILTAQGYWSP